MIKLKYVSTVLKCTECGMIFPIARPKSKRRQDGHIKDLYCPRCNKITKHVENNY